MTNESTQRKYEKLWDKLKVDLSVTIQLDHHLLLTPAQVSKRLKTIRKAVSKEKYYDLSFKVKHPKAEITSTLKIPEGAIEFSLTKDPEDFSALF